MKIVQRYKQKRIRQAIANTKKYRALADAEKVRLKILADEVKAKEELEALRAKVRKLKGKRGTTDLIGALKKLDRMIFGTTSQRRPRKKTR